MKTIEVNIEDAQDFVEWAKGKAFCNSGQHVCDRLATYFEIALASKANTEKELTKEDLFNMKLHEQVNLNSWTSISRVPCGWIYQFSVNEGTDYGVFVPDGANVEYKQT